MQYLLKSMEAHINTVVIRNCIINTTNEDRNHNAETVSDTNVIHAQPQNWTLISKSRQIDQNISGMRCDSRYLSYPIHTYLSAGIRISDKVRSSVTCATSSHP